MRSISVTTTPETSGRLRRRRSGSKVRIASATVRATQFLSTTATRIEQEMTTFVPVDAAGGRAGAIVMAQATQSLSSSTPPEHLRRYNDWVLGTHREQTGMHVVTKWKGDHDVLFARNAYHPDVGGHVALRASLPGPLATRRRTEFIGRNGTTRRSGSTTAFIASGSGPALGSIPAPRCSHIDHPQSWSRRKTSSSPSGRPSTNSRASDVAQRCRDAASRSRTR